MNQMRVVVTGGRDYNDEETVGRELQRMVQSADKQGKKIVFIAGGARGLDTLVEDWCLSKGVPCMVFRAPWNSHYGKRSGPVRNQWMIDYGMPTYGIVFPGGSGTADMLSRIKKAGINHHIVLD